MHRYVVLRMFQKTAETRIAGVETYEDHVEGKPVGVLRARLIAPLPESEWRRALGMIKPFIEREYPSVKIRPFIRDAEKPNEKQTHYVEVYSHEREIPTTVLGLAKTLIGKD